MKVTYTFDTDNEEDINELDIHKQTKDMYCVLVDLSNVFRGIRKYEQIDNNDITTMQDSEIVERLNDKFYELLGEHNISLEY